MALHTITIQVDDEDYNDMIEHLAKERLGRILVKVCKLVSTDEAIEPLDSEWLQNEWACIREEQAEEREARRTR